LAERKTEVIDQCKGNEGINARFKQIRIIQTAQAHQQIGSFLRNNQECVSGGFYFFSPPASQAEKEKLAPLIRLADAIRETAFAPGRCGSASKTAGWMASWDRS
jgi:hypothetical protein